MRFVAEAYAVFHPIHYAQRCALLIALFITCLSALLVSQLARSLIQTAEALFYNARLYDHIYWENGIPLADVDLRPDSWINPDCASEPDLILHTGYYNFRTDADDVVITGFDPSSGSDYLTALY